MKVDRNTCHYCGGCVSVCPVNAIELEEVYIKIDNKKCINCGACVKVCPVSAISKGRSK